MRTMEKKTPLYQTHVDMGGKIVEFGGFLMPVQYPTGNAVITTGCFQILTCFGSFRFAEFPLEIF